MCVVLRKQAPAAETAGARRSGRNLIRETHQEA